MKLKNIVLGLVSALSVFAQAGEKLIKNSDRVVFMGDSITYYGVSDSHGYVNLVRKGLAANGITPAYWAGVGIKGDVSQQMRDRFDSHSGGQDVTPKNPTVVPISAGVNDLLHNVSYETYIANMKWMVDRTKALGATPILLSPTATGYSEDDSDSLRKFAKGVRDLAASEGIAYAPIYEMFRGYVDDRDSPKVAYMNKDIVATCDACHMAPPGDRQFARAVLGAIGLDKDELSAAEAAWNSDDTLIPLGAYSDWIDHNVSINLSASELSALNAAGGLRAVLKRGIPSLAANPVAEAEASGASSACTVNKSTGYFNFKEYDQLLIAARKLNVTLESAIRYAVLRGVRNTAALSPSAPVVKSAEIHPGSTTATVEATIDAVGATASACDVFLKLGSGASQRIVVGENAMFDYQVSGLQPNTTYTYELTFKNNATTSMTVTKSGSFKTLAAGPLQPTGWDDAPMIQSALDAAVPSHGTVTLAGGVFNLGAELMVTGGVTLVGQGYDQTTLYQHSPHRGVTVADGSTLEGVTVQGGKTMSNWEHGAGVYLKNGTVTGCRVRWNYAGWAGSNIYGGGIYVEKGTIAHSVICENTVAGAACDGAGIGWRYSGGPVTIDTCLIYGNTTTTGTGGGIAVVAGNPEISIKNSTIAGNSAKNGGGISLDSQAKKVTLTNSIVSGNTVTGGSDVNMKGTLASASSNNVTADTVVFSDPSSGDFRVVSGASGIGYDEFNDTSAPHTHTWGTATYSWSADSATCTASATCTDNASHRTTETATAAYAVVTAATATTDGTGRYTATFVNSLFATQTKDVTIPKTGSGESGGSPADDPSGVLAATGDTTGAQDVSAIQAALDAAKPTKGTVTLGSGIYYINTQLLVDGGVTLQGQGWDKTVIKQVAQTATDGSTRVVTISGGSTVKHITLTGGHIETTANNKAGGAALISDGTISWCCVTNNSVTCGNSAYGGGIAFWQGKGQVDHTLVADNFAKSVSEDAVVGGGIGVYLPYGTITIDACLVCNNRSFNTTRHHSGKGGGIGVAFSGFGNKVTVRNTTIVGNRAGESVEGVTDVSVGGGLYVNDDTRSKFAMQNCIIANNTTVNASTETEISYSGATDYCLFGTAADLVGAHSKSGDPKFTNAAAGDYTLASASPAKNAGATYTGIGVDLAGNSFAATPSMGCYEFGSTAGTVPAPGGDSGEQGGTDNPPAVHTHNWGTPTYSWSADYATCTASATCTGDSTHKTNKTVTATSAVVKEATTTETGTKRYTATFAAPFATQTKDVTIPKVEETTPGGDTPSNPPVVNPPSVDPTGALTASGDTTGATDTKTIQDLIDAAAPTHGTVKLGEGTFYLNTQLMVTNGVTLTGLGSDKTILRQTVVGAGGNGEGGYGRCATVSGGATLFGVTVTGCRISAPWTHGAGLYVDGGTVSWCCISNNVGTGRNSYGGGISIADGTIDHCVIANNQGGEYTCGGGGIVAYNVSGTILIDSCLVYGNTASVKDQSGKGGGICITMNNPKVTIRNTTVTANTVGGDGGGLYLDTYSNGNIKLVNSIAYGNTASNNADVKGTTNSNWTNNLISVDPLFANAAAGNYTLMASSPAKGAGVTYSGIGLDLKGASFANPPSMGCYEYGAGTTPSQPDQPEKKTKVIFYVD